MKDLWLYIILGIVAIHVTGIADVGQMVGGFLGTVEPIEEGE